MIAPFLSEDARERKNILTNSRDIVYHLADEIGERTLVKYDNLNRARTFIKDSFIQHGLDPVEEKYKVEGKEVANIISEIKGFDQPDNIIIIGAHYDTVEDTPGADDNASAVAALLELHRLLSPFKFKKTIRFVAFTLEEPPYFSSDLMGSMKHAAGCKKRKEKIELMICLEMVGYASKKCKQTFPIDDMKDKYPPYGDYIGVFSLPSSSEYVFLWKKLYNRNAKHEIFEFIGPASIPGMDLSDHSSFVKNGFPAIMISDTGYYRNPNYHSPQDTCDTINFKFLSENILNTYKTLRDLLNLDALMKNN